MHPENKTSLSELANDVNLTTMQRQQLSLFVEALETWNDRTNLVSRQDVGRIVARHIRESLWFCRPEILANAVHVLDLGSGAGFPGLIMKITQPSLQMTLVDSRRMKTLFLQEMVEKLELGGTAVVCDRAENLAQKTPAQQHDLITCRAVAKLDQLWGWAWPLLAIGGVMAALKGGDLDAEISVFKRRFPEKQVVCLSMPVLACDPTAGRKMVLIKK